jgi:hypothetical protein
MIGGMISSTLLTLIVVPAIFRLVEGFRLPSGCPKGATEASAWTAGDLWIFVGTAQFRGAKCGRYKGERQISGTNPDHRHRIQKSSKP